MQSIPIEPLIHSITSPVVFVNPLGEKILANPAGERQFQDLALLFETLSGPTSNQRKLEALLACPWPSTVACEDCWLKITPIRTEGGTCQGGLLEWFFDSGEEKLRILQEVSRAVNSSLILEDIYESLGDVLRQYIPYHEAAIVILDDTQNGIKVLVRIDEDGGLEISGENNTFAGYDPVVDRMVKHPAPQLYGNGQLPASVVFSQEAASAMVVPLVNKGVVIGLIALSGGRETGFYYYQQELLTQVSVQLAIAVENAKLYWQTQAQAGREFLINQLTRAIRQSLEIDVILGTAVTELGKVLGISRCFIRYLSQPDGSPAGEEEQQTSIFAYQLPGTPALVEEMSNFEQKVFQLRQDQPYNPFILNDFRDCPPQLASAATLESNHIRSLAVVPILIRDTLVGTITLHQCDSSRVWVREDIELLQALAEHLGVALHQARLFMTLDRQKQELETTLEELQQAQLYLIQSEKMAVLGQFVAGIAHEVNTPLGTMMSNNATLKVCADKLRQDPSNPALHQSMEELLSLNKMAGERILEIVKNLRNFARLDESELKTVDIHEGIDSTLLLVKSSLSPNIEVQRRYDTTLPPVRCYPGLLNQVFMNLIVNASHALDEAHNGTGAQGRILIETLPGDAQGHSIHIRVRDNGKGIAPQNLPRIFDPGFTTKGSGVGTGLGLALCYRIVEKHGGKISVDSTLNEGTVFTVEIPIQ